MGTTLCDELRFLPFGTIQLFISSFCSTDRVGSLDCRLPSLCISTCAYVSGEHVLLARGRCFLNTGVSNVSVNVSSEFQSAMSRLLLSLFHWPSSVTEQCQDEMMTVMFCAATYMFVECHVVSSYVTPAHQSAFIRIVLSSEGSVLLLKLGEDNWRSLCYVLDVRECITGKKTKPKQKETEKKAATPKNRGFI